MSLNPRRFLRALFDSAVSAALPEHCLAAHFPEPPADGRLTVIACGVAAAGMARAAEHHYNAEGVLDRLTGIAVTRHGLGQPLQKIRLIEAGYPIADEASVYAAEQALALALAARPGDLILFLVSGGASSLCAAPAGAITLSEEQALTRAMLRAGARSHEINCVRKHLSRVDGGRLAACALPAALVTLAISDVPGDESEIIGFGPACPDATTLEEARSILAKYTMDIPPSVAAVLNDPANETPKPGDPVFANARYEAAATGRDSLEAAAELARSFGYGVVMLGDTLEGEARDVAQSHAQLARRCLADGRRTVILSGGELTVTVRGSARGRPNQEYALSLALALNGTKGVAALAAGTDGTDGGNGAVDDPAGAFTDSGTIARASALNLVPATFLENNDPTGFFRLTNDLLVCGPTGTNVNDFRAIVVDSAIRD